MSFKMPYNPTPENYTNERVLYFENNLIIVHQEGHQLYSKTKANPDLKFFWLAVEPFAWSLTDLVTGAYGPCFWKTITRKDFALERIRALTVALTEKGRRFSKDIRTKLPGLLTTINLILDDKFMPDLSVSARQVEIDEICQELDSLCYYYTKNYKQVFPDNWMDIHALARDVAFRNAGFSAD